MSNVETFRGESLRAFTRAIDRNKAPLMLFELTYGDDGIATDMRLVNTVYVTFTDEQHDLNDITLPSFERLISNQVVRHVYFFSSNLIPPNLNNGLYLFIYRGVVWFITQELDVANGIRGYRLISATQALLARLGLGNLHNANLMNFLPTERRGGGGHRPVGDRLSWLDFCPEIPFIRDCLDDIYASEIFTLQPPQRILFSNTQILFSNVNIRWGDRTRSLN